MGYTSGGVYACTGCPGDGYALDDPDPNPGPHPNPDPDPNSSPNPIPNPLKATAMP